MPEKPVRRRFDAEFKARILREADQFTQPGQLGALLRREGLYSSHLSVWRKQRDDAALAGLVGRRSFWTSKKTLPETGPDPGDRVAAKRLRERAMKTVEELTASVGTAVACEAIGVPRATASLHRLPKTAVAPKPRPAPPRALSGDERNRVLDVLHGEAFADKAPAETYAKLLDQGT